jgi:hypothetical protein
MRFSLLFNALTVAWVRLGGVLATALAAAGCATEPPPAELLQGSCSEPRPQVCTMIWAPVCAVHDDGHLQTHASACNACADSSVRAYTPGACADDESAS